MDEKPVDANASRSLLRGDHADPSDALHTKTPCPRVVLPPLFRIGG